MTLPPRKAIDHVEALGKLCQEPRDFFRGILDIVIHRDEGLESCAPNATKLGILLPEIPHQMNSHHPVVLIASAVNDRATSIAARIIYENHLELRRKRRQQQTQLLQEDRQAAVPLVERNKNAKR